MIVLLLPSVTDVLLTLFQMCELRHKAHGKKNFIPEGSSDTIAKGAYYLTKIDDMFRREYARKE